MKKILLSLLVAFALTANAQQRNYQIESQLKLEKVNLGTARDSVLVRGEDKIVKYVPRSEFGGGGETLQSILDAGKVASFDDGANTFEVLSGDPYFRSFNVSVSDTIYHSSQLSMVPNQVSLINALGGLAGYFNITDGKVWMGQSNTEFGQTDVYFEDPIAFTSIKFPAKIALPAGQYYKIATLDDIPVIETTAPASTGAAGSNKEIRLTSGYIYWYVQGTGWLRSAGSTF